MHILTHEEKNWLVYEIKEKSKHEILDVKYHEWTEMKFIHRSGARVNHQRKRFHFRSPQTIKVKYGKSELELEVDDLARDLLLDKISIQHYQKLKKEREKHALKTSIIFLLCFAVFIFIVWSL